jgi:hypothetical protein
MKNVLKCFSTCERLAERVGFEPTIHFWRIHTFQACSFDHSDTSPELDCKGINKMNIEG